MIDKDRVYWFWDSNGDQNCIMYDTYIDDWVIFKNNKGLV